MKQNRLVRVGEVALTSGLPISVVSRLADRGVIPFVRPLSAGNRFYDLEEVLEALDRAKAKVCDDEVLEESSGVKPVQSLPASEINQNREQATRGKALDGEGNEFEKAMETVLKELKQGRKNLQQVKSLPKNSLALALNEFHTMLLERAHAYHKSV